MSHNGSHFCKFAYLCRMESESGFFATNGSLSTCEDFSGVELLNSSTEGFCRVFAARHHGRKVILKSLKPVYATDLLAQTQLRKEYALGFSVDSDYVCRTLGRHTLTDGCQAIEMEYCAGMTLRELFDTGVMMEYDKAVAVAESLVKGLSAIHSKGIVHRDIKPTNIIVSPNTGITKIIDFGCAHSDDYIALQGPVGTAGYTPPEKQTAGCIPQISDDYYALGMVMAEMAQHVESKVSGRFATFGRRLISGRPDDRGAMACFEKLTARRRGRAASAIAVGLLVVMSLSYPVLRPRELPSAAVDLPDSAKTVVTEENLAQTALGAGPLIAKVESGDASPAEKADYYAIKYADSLYFNTLMSVLADKSFASSQCEAMALESCRDQAAAFDSVFLSKAGFLPADRHRQLFYERLKEMLKLYHSHRSQANSKPF